MHMIRKGQIQPLRLRQSRRARRTARVAPIREHAVPVCAPFCWLRVEGTTPVQPEFAEPSTIPIDFYNGNMD